MRFVLKFLAAILALLVAAVVAAVFVLQDANRLKPEIEQLIREYSDYNVAIRGDLDWQLFPPLRLRIADVSAKEQTSAPTQDGQEISAEHIELSMDLSAMWEDVDQWQVRELALTNVRLLEDGATTHIKQLDLENFRLGEPAPFATELAYTSEPGTEPIDATIRGRVTYFPSSGGEPERIVLRETHIESAQATGTCEADIKENLAAPAQLPEVGDDALLPVDSLLSYDLAAQCHLDTVVADTETFTNVATEITNVGGNLNVHADIADFMGGSVAAEVGIDVAEPEPIWTISPDVSGVDSQRLLNWTDQRLTWIAPIALNGDIRMRGNTEAALMNSIKATSEFDGGQGQLDITKLKEQLLAIASLAQRGEKIENWPELWNYEHFTGRWNIDGANHALAFALDNMSVKADGQVDYASATMDMLAHVTIHEAPEASPFEINPLLEGTPIPVRCRGPSDDPTCRVDRGEAQNIVARALQGEDSGLRRKLDQKIEEEVPEEYRDAARSILDIIGRSLEQ